MKMLVLIPIGIAYFLSWLTAKTYLFGFSESILLPHLLAALFCGITVFSFISGRIVHGRKVRFLYKIVNILFGFAFYFFLGAVLLSLLYAFSAIDMKLATLIVAAMAFLSGILGFVHARLLTIKTYTVTLEGAPDTWKNKKAVFLSDTHFGLINHEAFSEKIIRKILELNPDFVLHGGDFYDGPDINLEPITETWKQLTRTVPVFYTSGNHEHYGNYDAFITSIQNAGIETLLNKKILYDGVQIAGITYLGKNKKAEAKNIIDNLGLDADRPSILINHPPTFHDAANNVSINLMLSGHTHRGQFSPMGFITWLIYGRFNYGMKKAKNMISITSRGVGTAGPPLRLFNKPELVVLSFDIMQRVRDSNS